MNLLLPQPETISATNSSAPRRRRWRTTAPILCGVILAAAGVAVGVRAADAAVTGPAIAASCQRHDVTTALTTDPGAPQYRIAGWLCQPRHPARTVQLLVAGLTYSHAYWFGPDPDRGYVAAALAAGDATYVIDRVGTGASDRPPADQVTPTSEAYATHQIVQALRGGRLARYEHVVAVGHSFGSFVAMTEAARYRDVDALVLTGLLHQSDQTAVDQLQSALYPATDDPAFTATTPPDGYLTTRPGQRADLFLNPWDTPFGMTGWDEAVKATATTGELAFNPADETAASRQLQTPVLLLVGSRDALFCSSTLPCRTGADLCHREHDDYPQGLPLYAAIIREAGHSINEQRHAVDAFTITNRWLTAETSRTGPAGRPVLIDGTARCAA